MRRGHLKFWQEPGRCIWDDNSHLWEAAKIPVCNTQQTPYCVTSMTHCMSARISWIAGSVLKSNGAEALSTPTQKLNPVPNKGVEMRTPAMPAKYEPVACSGLPDVGTCKELWLLAISPDNKLYTTPNAAGFAAMQGFRSIRYPCTKERTVNFGAWA